MEHSESTIIEEWAAVGIPPPPELQAVTIDPETTALLILDIQKGNCNMESRPRCVASVPKIQQLLARARGSGMAIVYSLTSTAQVSDVREEVAPLAEESVVRSSVDKFYNTDLEKILRTRGIETVIVVGTSAHGAVLHTATGAALRGLHIIVPVDGLSAGEPYAEQYTCWHLANAPGTRQQAVLTRMDMIAF
ncbi:MAG: cysteine hydrolase [Anaerolineales bacterium]